VSRWEKVRIDLDDEVSNKPAKQEAALAKRRIDKEKFERADREARKLIDAERQARDAKTARLRELRLSAGQDLALAKV
jgi:hypothetical protein